MFSAAWAKLQTPQKSLRRSPDPCPWADLGTQGTCARNVSYTGSLRLSLQHTVASTNKLSRGAVWAIAPMPREQNTIQLVLLSVMNCDVRRATFQLHKCRKTVWQRGSARTRSLGELTALPQTSSWL
jgi:hypothetical protein